MPGWLIGLVVGCVILGIAGLATSVVGMNRPPARRRQLMIAGATLTLIAAAGLLVTLGTV